MSDEKFLLAVLNTTPVEPDRRQDDLQGAQGLTWLVAHGGARSSQERDSLVEARELLQQAVRGEPDVDALAWFLEGVAAVPVLGHQSLTWTRQLPSDRELAARVVLAWAAVGLEHPNRLRACANSECARFLIDRSRANQARWCSMARCGNRAKARRHYQRARGQEEVQSGPVGGSGPAPTSPTAGPVQGDGLVVPTESSSSSPVVGHRVLQPGGGPTGQSS